VAGFAHLYACVSKFTFLSTLTGRTIHNLEDVNCPPPETFNHKHWCTLSCQKFPKFACATKTEHDWLIHYLQTKDYVQCPPDMTSYFRFYCSPIRWTCTSACPVTLRWLLDANGRPTLLLLRRRGWSSWSCCKLPISVPIGPTILHSVQRGCCFVSCFPLMRTGPNTCLVVSTLLATIYHWWNMGLSGEAVGPKPSFSAMNKWTL